MSCNWSCVRYSLIVGVQSTHPVSLAPRKTSLFGYPQVEIRGLATICCSGAVVIGRIGGYDNLDFDCDLMLLPMLLVTA